MFCRWHLADGFVKSYLQDLDTVFWRSLIFRPSGILDPPVDCDPFQHFHVSLGRQWLPDWKRIWHKKLILKDAFHNLNTQALGLAFIVNLNMCHMKYDAKLFRLSPTCQGMEGRQQCWAPHQGGGGLFGRGPAQPFTSHRLIKTCWQNFLWLKTDQEVLTNF